MITLALAEFLFALILLISAYIISHTISGFFQATLTNALGDPTAVNEGYQSTNPLDHIDIASFLALIIFGVGWLQTVPIDPHAFTGFFRYLKLLIALAVEAFVSICIATIALFASVYFFGYVLTKHLITKLFIYYSKFFLLFFSSTSTLNIASAFSADYSSLSVVCAFLLISIVYLNISIATISCIYNGFRYLFVLGFDRGYAYMDYADYIAILGPLCVIFFFGNQLMFFLWRLTDWATCQFACIVGIT